MIGSHDSTKVLRDRDRNSMVEVRDQLAEVRVATDEAASLRESDPEGPLPATDAIVRGSVFVASSPRVNSRHR